VSVEAGGGSGVFGELLRRCRMAAGLTQEELAWRSGLSVRAVADMERGRTTRPYRRSVALLTNALELTGEDRELMAKAAGAAKAKASSPAGRPALVSLPAMAPPPSVPHQLPASVRYFTGRAAELRDLAGLLEPVRAAGETAVISAITGTAGVGKTALAMHWARQVAGRFPDGQLHVDLRGFGPAGAPLTSAEAVRLFLDGLGVPSQRIPADLDGQAGLYRSLLAGRRVLIVLDNARDAAQVRPLLPGSPGCLVLITSRDQLTGLAAADDAHLLTLDVLTEEEAREMLESRLGQGRVAAEPAAVAELTGLCARLPLALAIAAARAAACPGLPLAALAGELRDARTRLDALGTGDAATDARTVFSWSCRQLSSPAARMFRLLGVHPGPDITVPAAASLTGVSLPQARRALAELARAHLITEHSPGRYACHDLLRTYAAEQVVSCDSATVRRAAARRVLDHYLHTACAASLLLQPARDRIALDPPQPRAQPEELAGPEQALAWFRAERQVLLAAISRAAGGGFGARAWQLPWAVAGFFGGQGYWAELVTTQQSALAAARRADDRAGQAQAHRYLGKALGCGGAYAEAGTHLSAALELGRQAGSLALQARVHLDLGWLVELQGRGPAGLGHAEQALCLYRAAGSRLGEAEALNQVGWEHARLGGYQQALEFCEKALALHRELADRPGEAVTLDSLGYAHHHLGHHGEAITCYLQAIDVHGEAGHLDNMAEMLTHLGDSYQAAGDPDAARGTWQRALVILDDLNDHGAAQVRTRLSRPVRPPSP
jgi:tetratricopeptide (TPR) repeat protein/transcriptional regulator with XRE-family HTH domain